MFLPRLKTFSLWGTLVGLAFFSVYPTTNWLASLRGSHFDLFFAAELAWPFVPAFIWPYLSMYALFVLPPFFLDVGELELLAKRLIFATLVAGGIFIALPARLGFVRTLPEDGLYRTLFSGMFAVDRPYNLVPSLHVVYSTTIMLAIAGRARGWPRALWAGWLGVILVSTLFVHQHHLVDVATGVLLSFSAIRLIGDKNA